MPGYLNRFAAEALLAYPLPLLLAVVAWLPIDSIRGILFSAHGGVGWLLLTISLPWLIVRAIALLFGGPAEARIRRGKCALSVMVAYLPVSVACAYSLIFALNPPLTNTLRNVLPWFYFPASLLIDGW